LPDGAGPAAFLAQLRNQSIVVEAAEAPMPQRRADGTSGQ
jgi:hypothetical protein